MLVIIPERKDKAAEGDRNRQEAEGTDRKDNQAAVTHGWGGGQCPSSGGGVRWSWGFGWIWEEELRCARQERRGKGEEPSVEDWLFCLDSPGPYQGKARTRLPCWERGPPSFCCHFRGSCMDRVS